MRRLLRDAHAGAGRGTSGIRLRVRSVAAPRRRAGHDRGPEARARSRLPQAPRRETARAPEARRAGWRRAARGDGRSRRGPERGAVLLQPRGLPGRGGRRCPLRRPGRQHGDRLPAEEARRRSEAAECFGHPGLRPRARDGHVLAAEGIRRVGDAECVKIYVGGLPQHPEPPLNYQIVYSLEGALDYYTTPSWVLRDGKPARVDALSELEHVTFPPPVGQLEAFHTGGGISTLPWAYEGKVRTMEYKTLRYPGHIGIMRPIRELGLLDLTPVKVKGKEVVPRDAFIATVSPKLTKPEGRDLVALRVEVRGRNGRQIG